MRSRRWTWVAVAGLAMGAAGAAVGLNLPERVPQAPLPLPAASAATAGVGGTSPAKGEATAASPGGSTASTRAGHPLATGATPPLDTVFFLNDQLGWAGGQGVVLGTTDGGATWEAQYTGTATIRQVDFADATQGWALTSTGLLTTQNGGQSWSAVRGTTPSLTQIDFVSATQGWGVGASGLEFTTDGGTHWQMAATPVPVQSVCFSSAETGWAAGGTAGASTVLHTTDGGSDWQVAYHVPVIVPFGAVPSRFSAQVRCGGGTAWVLVAVHTLVAFQQPYAIFFTDNGGHSWREPFAQPYSAPGLFPGAPRNIGGAAGAFAAMGGGGAVFVGLCPSCGTSQPLSGGVDLTVTANAGQTVRQQVLYGITALPSSGIVPASPALAFPDAEHGWVATTSGTAGRIYATADGGRSWTQQYPPAAGQPLAAVSMVTSQQGYGLGAIGVPGAVLETRDGGRTWSAIGQLPAPQRVLGAGAIPASPSLGLSFTSAASGWAVNGSALERTTDGGRTWTAEDLPAAAGQGAAATARVVGVAFLPGGETGCVQESVGGSSSYLGTADGGQSWTAVALPGPALSPSGHTLPGEGGAQGALACALQESGRWSAALQSIVSSGQGPVVLAAVGPSALWTAVLGEAGTHLNATADGGTTWVTYTLTAHSGIQSVSFVTAEDGWLLTAGGRILRTVDGGASWAPV